MTKTKTPPRCTTTGTAKKQSIAKSSNCIVSLKRAAVKLAIVKKTHGDSKYAKEYLAIADLMELHFSYEEEKQEAAE